MEHKVTKVKKIDYLHPVKDLGDDYLDILVTLEENSNHFVEITTPKFLIVLMKKVNFCGHSIRVSLYQSWRKKLYKLLSKNLLM